MFKRKADLSINVIIVAALALIVFVVLAAMFTGKSRIFSSGLESCTSKQGTCETSCDGAIVSNTDCGKGKESGNPICCIKVLS